MIKVAVIDYSMGNLLSVRRALEHCGAQVQITSEPKAILNADCVILPGVGAFSAGMAALKTQSLDEVIKQVASSGKPLLGICLGMQMLMEESEEFGLTTGLGLVQGRVIEIPSTTPDGIPLKRPHIGWNDLLLPLHAHDWNASILQYVDVRESMYFVHSFMAVPTDILDRLADCRYGNILISACIKHGNVTGCQFHPEKSGEAGLQILKSFIQG